MTKKKKNSYQKLKENNEKLQDKLAYMISSNRNLVKESIEAGEHLSNQIFIPEYLGFEETELEDKNTLVTQARIYSRQGFSISRLQENQWAILTPNRIKNTVKIDNMLDGIYALKLSGMDITPSSIMGEEVVMNKFKEALSEQSSDLLAFLDKKD